MNQHTNIMKTAIVFYRVSTKKQDNDRQKEDVERYCKGYDIKIILDPFEETISGASKLEDRSKLLACLEAVKTSKPDYLIVSELSRLGRTNDVLSIIKNLTKLGVCFVSLKENLITLDENKELNPLTKLMLNILAGINEFELSTISYRIKSGKNNKVVNNGSFGGGTNICYGYQSIDKKLVVNDVEALIVNDIFNKYALGWGTIKISHWLDSQNIPTRHGDKWQRGVVYNLLCNKIYVGVRKWDKEYLTYNQDLRIIDNQLWNTVQKRMIEQKQVNFDFNKLKKYDYLFDNKIIRCSCGKHFVGIQRYNYYKCTSGKYSKGCGVQAINIDWLDSQVQNYMAEHWGELLENNNKIATNINLLLSEIELIKAERQKEIRKQERQLEAFLDQRISKAVYVTKDNKSIEIINKIVKNIKEKELKLIENKKIEKNLIKAEFILNEQGKYERQSLSIDKQLLHENIRNILAYNEKIVVQLINGSEFSILRPLK